MRYFKYLGDHAETTLFGVVFRAGVSTAVDPEMKPRAARKLANNSHFAEVFDGVDVVGPASEPATEMAEIADDVDDIESLRIEASAKGIKVDRRWKEQRLRDEIAKAQ